MQAIPLFFTPEVPEGKQAARHALALPQLLFKASLPFQVQASGSAALASWRKKLEKKPAARASILTGLYITVVGLALAAAPCKVFGLLFDSRQAGSYHLP